MTEHVAEVDYGHRRWIQATVTDALGRYGCSVRATADEALEVARQRLADWQHWRPQSN